MGFLFRVRMASFFAGAATASIAGFYLLYKDYMFAHDTSRLQVNKVLINVDERYEALNQCTTILEIQKDAAATDNATEVNNIYQNVDERYEALNQCTKILEIQKDAAATDNATEV